MPIVGLLIAGNFQFDPLFVKVSCYRVATHPSFRPQNSFRSGFLECSGVLVLGVGVARSREKNRRLLFLVEPKDMDPTQAA